MGNPSDPSDPQDDDKDFTSIFETLTNQPRQSDEPELGWSPDSQDAVAGPSFEIEPSLPEVTDDAYQQPPPPLPKAMMDRRGDQVMDEIRDYAENSPVGSPEAPSEYPFSVMIEGKLRAPDRSKLMDLLSSNKVGISEMDLEAQFHANRVLIPRISEYLGVLIIQALRDAPVTMKLAPADEVFTTVGGSEVSSLELKDYGPSHATVFSSVPSHQAESIPIVSGQDEDVDQKVWELIDAVSASAFLQSTMVEVERSLDFEEKTNSIKKELKFKAYQKGADAIVNFSMTLTPLSSPMQYRLIAIGTAVKKR